MTRQYEYLSIDVDYGDEISVDKLNELGADGWQFAFQRDFSRYSSSDGRSDYYDKMTQFVFFREKEQPK